MDESESFFVSAKTAQKLADVLAKIEECTAIVRSIISAESVSIDSLNLSVRSRNCMANMGIKTVGQLSRTSKHELLKCRNMGKRSLAEIESKLSALGITLPYL